MTAFTPSDEMLILQYDNNGHQHMLGQCRDALDGKLSALEVQDLRRSLTTLLNLWGQPDVSLGSELLQLRTLAGRYEALLQVILPFARELTQQPTEQISPELRRTLSTFTRNVMDVIQPAGGEVA